MKNFLINCMLLLLFLCGLGLLMYPTVSNLVNERNQSTVITQYEQEVDLLEEAGQAYYRRAAQTYNESLPTMFTNEDPVGTKWDDLYQEMLNPTGDGIMGVLQIDKINVNLPIYHGTSEDVLQVAVGHLPATSLPVGGESTHAVLSAHTGLPSAKLFTELDQLEMGDMFKITVLGEMLVYQVCNIRIVEPDDSDSLRIFEGEDYVSLVTCTPYGINSHRLIVTGTRIQIEEAEKEGLFVETDAVFLDKTLLIPFAVIPIVIIYFFWVAVKTSGKRKNNGGDNP
ncbi:MAG: class C sortase [Ruminococcus sp.]|nr:class C sortase [Ruminococcus sp.]